MGKSLFVMQSNYIPWKGYFDAIALADHFVIYDIVQYTKNDWRNRNKLKSPKGTIWVTIPIETKGLFGQTVLEAKTSSNEWIDTHLGSITTNYKKSQFYSKYEKLIFDKYYSIDTNMLSKINVSFIQFFMEILEIETPIHFADEYDLPDDRNMRLIELCKILSCDVYFSGPAAKAYLNTELFEQVGIEVRWLDYSGYKEYNQLFPPFEHGVSIIDLLLNCGPDAQKFMKYTKV